MNIYGLENKLKKIKKKIAELKKERDKFEDRVYWGRRNRSKTIKVGDETYTIEEAETSLQRLNYEWDIQKKRGINIANQLKLERDKQNKRKKKK